MCVISNRIFFLNEPKYYDEEWWHIQLERNCDTEKKRDNVLVYNKITSQEYIKTQNKGKPTNFHSKRWVFQRIAIVLCMYLIPFNKNVNFILFRNAMCSTRPESNFPCIKCKQQVTLKNTWQLQVLVLYAFYIKMNLN